MKPGNRHTKPNHRSTLNQGLVKWPPTIPMPGGGATPRVKREPMWGLRSSVHKVGFMCEFHTPKHRSVLRTFSENQEASQNGGWFTAEPKEKQGASRRWWRFILPLLWGGSLIRSPVAKYPPLFWHQTSSFLTKSDQRGEGDAVCQNASRTPRWPRILHAESKGS